MRKRVAVVSLLISSEGAEFPSEAFQKVILMNHSKHPLEIDGARGEGGGQVLRTSVGLAGLLGRPVRVSRVRAGRKKPGLLRQHRTAVRAAARVCAGQIEGAELGSREVVLRPGKITHGTYEFSIGSAGSTTLVLQTILPGLMATDGESRIGIEGGTHNPLAPPFQFLKRAFLPALRRFGPEVSVHLVTPGFFPAGGGRLEVLVSGVNQLTPCEFVDRGALRSISLHVLLSNLPRSIGEREAEVVCRRLSIPVDQVTYEVRHDGPGQGNSLEVILEFENLTEVFTELGSKGTRAEKVAEKLSRRVEGFLSSPVAVGEYLADQLLLPMGLAGGGRLRTFAPSGHSRTQLAMVGELLGLKTRSQDLGEGVHELALGSMA